MRYEVEGEAIAAQSSPAVHCLGSGRAIISELRGPRSMVDVEKETFLNSLGVCDIVLVHVSIKQVL